MDGRVIIQKVDAGIATRLEEVADIRLARVRKPASVKSHGGFIKFYSEVGRGAEFRIYLPAAESPHAISEAVQTDWPMGNGELILVIDDEAAVSELAKNVLETFGASVNEGMVMWHGCARSWLVFVARRKP